MEEIRERDGRHLLGFVLDSLKLKLIKHRFVRLIGYLAASGKWN